MKADFKKQYALIDCDDSDSKFDLTHSVPLSADVLRAQVGVWVDSGQLDAVGLGDLQDLIVDAHGGHALFVGLGQSGLELVMSCDQTLHGRKKRFRVWRMHISHKGSII